MSGNDSTGAAIAKVLEPIVHEVTLSAAAEIGTTLAGAVKIALAPINAAIWTYEQAAAYAEEKVTEILRRRGINAEEVASPSADIAASTIQLLRLRSQADELRALYLNLLATSMHAPSRVHPAYIEIVRQMSADEARLVPYFLPSEFTMRSYQVIRLLYNDRDSDASWDSAPGYITTFPQKINVKSVNPHLENLDRLGIIDITFEHTVGGNRAYAELESSTEARERVNDVAEELGLTPDTLRHRFQRGKVGPTVFGAKFIAACGGLGALDTNVKGE